MLNSTCSIISMRKNEFITSKTVKIKILYLNVKKREKNLTSDNLCFFIAVLFQET